MKNTVVPWGYTSEVSLFSHKIEKFPVNSLFFRELGSETGYRKTASTTKLLINILNIFFTLNYLFFNHSMGRLSHN